MNSFFTTLKKHGFKLCLANIAGFIINCLTFFLTLYILNLIILDKIANSFQTSSSSSLFDLSSIAYLLWIVIDYAIIMILLSFFIGGSLGITIEAVTNNCSFIDRYFRSGLKNFKKIFGITFLFGILDIIFDIIIYLALTEFKYGLDTTLNLLWLLPLLILQGLVFLNASIISIVEQTGVFKSISLSFRLFKSSFKELFVTILYLIALLTLYLFITLLLLHLPKPSASDLYETMIILIVFLVLPPLILSLNSLTFVHRYFKYMRPLVLSVDSTREESYSDQPELSLQESNHPPSSLNT